MRRCAACRVEKALDAFYLDKHKPLGRGYRCRDCEREYRKRLDWDRKNRDRRRVLDRARWAKRKSSQVAYRAANADRYRELDGQRYERDKPKRLELARTHSKQRRARLRGCAGSVSKSQWDEILEMFDRRCAFCLSKLEKPTLDHFTPLSRGGDHSPENVVPACDRCNKRKHARQIIAWVPLLVG